MALAVCAAASCKDERGTEQHRRLAHAPLAERLAFADPGRGAALFTRCAACHNIARGGADRDGPNLYGVVGNAVGRNSPRFGYTGALQAVGGIWTFDKLDRWLTAPQRFAPGTMMMFPGVADGADRADLIAYLDANGGRLPLPRR